MVARRRCPPGLFSRVTFLVSNFLATQHPVALSPSRYPLSCASLSTSRWPFQSPSRLLIPHSLMRTRPGGTMYIDRTTLLVANLAKSISTSVLTTPDSPTTQSDSARAVRLTCRLIMCVPFVLESDASTHPQLPSDRRTQFTGNFSLLCMGKRV